MPQEVRAVVALSKGEPVSVQTVVVPDPGPHEVVVRVETCGVCHTDLTTARAAFTRASRSCSATRRQGGWRRSVTP